MNFFDTRLESLRGIAAVAVVITHSLAIYRIDGCAAFWALPFHEHTIKTFTLEFVTALFNAGSAVVLFFVLSGYVLTLSLQHSSDSLIGYAVKRAFRLLPPMRASIILVVAGAPRDQPARHTALFRLVHFGLCEAVNRRACLQCCLAGLQGQSGYLDDVYRGGRLGIPSDRDFRCWRFGLLARYGLLAILLLTTLLLKTPSATFSYLLCFYTGAMLATMQPRKTQVARERVLLGFLIFFVDRFFFVNGNWDILANTLGSVFVIAGVTNGALAAFCRFRSHATSGRSRIVSTCCIPLVILPVGLFLSRFFDRPGFLAAFVALAAVVPVSTLVAVSLIKPSESRVIDRLSLAGAGKIIV